MANERRGGGPQVNESVLFGNGCRTVEKEVRAKMEDFWKEHSQNASEEEMMLDTNADILGKEEIPEILSMLPNVKGKDVLELGAGIGRFTGHIARKSKTLVAVDFMENFVRRNEEINGHLKNITFLQADVTYLDYPTESFDLVFSNWLLMYLEENEVKSLFSRVFDWLKPGGFFYFRESCFHQSGNRSRDSNPSQYRKPSTYNNILRQVNVECDKFSLKLIMSKSIQSYIRMKNNRNQICWLVQKVPSDDSDVGRDFGEPFETCFTPVEAINAMEKCFGSGHVRSGEKQIFERIVHHLRPDAASRILNVGCGLGGMSFRLAQEYKVKVHGVDPSANMVALCLERANLLKQNNIQFQMDDLCQLSVPNEFDAVLFWASAGIKDHLGIFQKIRNSLNDGGRLVVVDDCIRVKDASTLLSQGTDRCNNHLLTQDGYKEVLLEAGFEVEHEEYLSDVKLEALKRDMLKLQDHNTLTLMLKQSMTKMIAWLTEQELKVVCFVCRPMSH